MNSTFLRICDPSIENNLVIELGVGPNYRRDASYILTGFFVVQVAVISYLSSSNQSRASFVAFAIELIACSILTYVIHGTKLIFERLSFDEHSLRYERGILSWVSKKVIRRESVASVSTAHVKKAAKKRRFVYCFEIQVISHSGDRFSLLHDVSWEQSEKVDAAINGFWGKRLPRPNSE
jgi:hypothetical protein